MMSANFGANIIKSTAVMALSSVAVLVLSMLRMKAAAVYVGPIGVGIIYTHLAFQALLISFMGFGIQARSIAIIGGLRSIDDKNELSIVVHTIRRLGLALALLAILLMAGPSDLLSQWLFGNYDYSADIAWLGISAGMMILANINIGFIQAHQMVKELAISNLAAAFWGSFFSVILIYFFRLDGIIWSIFSISFFQLFVSWIYVYKIDLGTVRIAWHDSAARSLQLIKDGSGLMLGSLSVTAASLLIVSMISKSQGLDAVGIYNAAFTLSGVFIGFALSSLAVDFYPKIIRVLRSKRRLNYLLNQQIRVTIYLVLPGLVLMSGLSHLVIVYLYSNEFDASVNMLKWFVLAGFGRIVTWPVGYLLMAMGKTKIYFLTELLLGILHVVLTYCALRWFGFELVGVAYYSAYALYALLICLWLHYVYAIYFYKKIWQAIIFAQIILFSCLVSIDWMNLITYYIFVVALVLVSVYKAFVEVAPRAYLQSVSLSLVGKVRSGMKTYWRR